MRAALCWALFILYAGGGLAENVGRFWHVTDFHYDHTYWTSQLSCNDNVSEPGEYGDYWCDAPWLLVQDSINTMAAVNGDVDFIIWTGDTVAHIKDKDTNLSLNMEIIRNITRALTNGFPGVPVYASLGNHDFYPSDQAEAEESDLYRQVADMWEDWIINQSQVQLFRGGGYYMAMTQPTIRLLALNTNLYYRQNKITKDMDDPAGQMAWMDNQLKEAKLRNEKVILTGHVPPGLLTPDFVDWFHPIHRTKFMDLLFRYSDIIVAAHFGHDHSDGFKILQNENGDQAVPQFTAPSVTPWRYRIPEKTGEPHNPGVRLVEYNRTTGEHTNYHQYYMNLTESNRKGRTEWRKLYSFIDAYDVEDMNVPSLRKIFSRLEKGGGKEYSSKFCQFALASSHEKPCTDEMRADIYCGGLEYNLTKAQECSKKYLADINAAHKQHLNAHVIIVSLLAIVLKMLY